MWIVNIHRKVDKFFKKLKKSDRKRFEILASDFDLLKAELELEGSEGKSIKKWRNYGTIKNTSGKNCQYHCHLSFDYVVCWEITDYDLRVIEIYHVSSHENAPY